MKKLILILFLFIGCENPVMNLQDKPINEVNKIYFTVFQDYGYCDSTGCYGVSVIKFQDSTDNNISYSKSFLTGNSKYWNGERWLESSGFYLMYESKTTFVIVINNESYTLNNNGTLILNLPFDTNINVIVN